MRVFEDEGGLESRDLAASRERVEGEVAEVIGVANGDVDEKVVRSRYVEERQRLREGEDVSAEALQELA